MAHPVLPQSEAQPKECFQHPSHIAFAFCPSSLGGVEWGACQVRPMIKDHDHDRGPRPRVAFAAMGICDWKDLEAPPVGTHSLQSTSV